jgi:hypothetical protein
VEKIGQIEIRVTGKKGNLDLKPDNYDIREIIEVLQNAEVDYNPSYKEDYIKSLITKAKKSWADVKDADEWLENVRGYGA